MNAQPIIVFAKWQVKQGQVETVLQLLGEVARQSMQEEGNLFYRIHQGIADPDTLILHEGYADEQAIEAHRNSAYFQELVIGQIVPLLENREVITARKIN